MRKTLANVVPKLNAAVDWFIPAHLKESQDILQAVRMFLFSHLFGPFLGLTICLSMLIVGGRADLSWWIFFAAVTAFWPFALVLRLTGWYVPLALVSIENLMFCIFWGCYQYGGISSPIMPWLVTVPLLAFFYLPERKTRIIVAGLIVANLGLFYAVYSAIGFRSSVAPNGLVVLGLVSTLCASVYVSMMAIYFANIVSSQGELEQEVWSHKATERKLREATGQAQRALQAKSEFLAKMSHELKNPLNAIIGYSEILIEELDSLESQKCTDLTSIRGAGFRLLELIDDLLDLSRLEAGKVELHLEEFDLADFFEKLVSQHRPSLVEGGNELIVQAPPEVRIVGDRHKLRRVLEGLLSNAAKFTSNGRITFSASMQDGAWSFLIEDTGAGIAESQMASLFETFGSSEDETASKYVDDVRLGLPLAYRYCQLMGAKLSIQSQQGRGSTVTVTLPTPLRGVQARAETELELQR